jgi:hypothetical protein
MNEPAPRCDRDRMRPIAVRQLVQDVLEMNLHGMLGQKEPFSDVAIPISLLDVAQNVKFKSREPFIAEMLGEPSSDLGQTRFFPAWTCRVVSRLSEVVCKNVSGLLVERTPGHDEDSRAPVLIKGSVT